MDCTEALVGERASWHNSYAQRINNSHREDFQMRHTRSYKDSPIVWKTLNLCEVDPIADAPEQNPSTWPKPRQAAKQLVSSEWCCWRHTICNSAEVWLDSEMVYQNTLNHFQYTDELEVENEVRYCRRSICGLFECFLRIIMQPIFVVTLERIFLIEAVIVEWIMFETVLTNSLIRIEPRRPAKQGAHRRIHRNQTPEYAFPRFIVNCTCRFRFNS